MKNIAAVIIAASLLLSGCARQPVTATTPTAPSPNAALLSLAISGPALCNITGALVPSVAGWLAGPSSPCVVGMTGILSVIEANGTVAQIQAAIDTMRSTAAAIPSASPGYVYISAAISLAQSVLNAYEVETGQGVTASTAYSPLAYSFAPGKTPGHRKIKWTREEKRRIEAAIRQAKSK